ncbi:MAG TPA: helix-turn-helix domain-containing protein [Rhizomicrobium sp.]|nr:helix-turn-helix domain-containing protein [Rhizomicrobium sp.]
MLVGVPHRRQTIAAHTRYPRHAHGEAYAAIVLSGGYVEAGARGRWRVQAGDVLLHDAFEPHRDEFGRGDCEIVNLSLPRMRLPRFVAGSIADPDAILRCDPKAAADLLLDRLRPRTDCEQDWPDLLAAALRRDHALALAGWARCHGLSAATLSRGFFRAYGVTPARFRAEARAQKAFAAIAGGARSLAAIAAETGFSDQPHMTRGIVGLTGRTPRQIRSRQPAAAASS